MLEGVVLQEDVEEEEDDTATKPCSSSTGPFWDFFGSVAPGTLSKAQGDHQIIPLCFRQVLFL